MYLKLYLSCFLICIMPSVNSQAPSLMRATLAMGGVSVIPSGNEKIYVIQSIGQSGVPGVFRGNGFDLRQGFIQPVKVNITRSDADIKNISIWPNPFSERIYINLYNKPQGIAELIIYDITGKVVYSEIIYVESIVSVNLSSLSRGIFFINIRKNNLHYNAKIIKN